MIIMITGKKQSGKDTTANIIKTHFPKLKFSGVALANAMKTFTCQLLDIPLYEVEDLKVQEDNYLLQPSKYRQSGATMRTFLQNLGQGIKEIAKDDLIWCRHLARSMHVEDTNYLLTDIRFPFEQQFFAQLGKLAGVSVVTIRVERDDDSPTDTHISEQNFDKIPYDYLIKNNGTLAELENKVATIMTQLILR